MVLGVLMSRKRRVRATHGRAREAKTHSFLSYIYLGYFVCLSQLRRSAILLVLVIKLTKDPSLNGRVVSVLDTHLGSLGSSPGEIQTRLFIV